MMGGTMTMTTLASVRMPMFTRCLFCHRTFPENGQLARMPRGRKIAFDPVLGEPAIAIGPRAQSVQKDAKTQKAQVQDVDTEGEAWFI